MKKGPMHLYGYVLNSCIFLLLEGGGGNFLTTLVASSSLEEASWLSR